MDLPRLQDLRQTAEIIDETHLKALLEELSNMAKTLSYDAAVLGVMMLVYANKKEPHCGAFDAPIIKQALEAAKYMAEWEGPEYDERGQIRSRATQVITWISRVKGVERFQDDILPVAIEIGAQLSQKGFEHPWLHLFLLRHKMPNAAEQIMDTLTAELWRSPTTSLVSFTAEIAQDFDQIPNNLKNTRRLSPLAVQWKKYAFVMLSEEPLENVAMRRDPNTGEVVVLTNKDEGCVPRPVDTYLSSIPQTYPADFSKGVQLARDMA